MTKNKARSQRAWPQKTAYEDRDYFTGRTIEGEWKGMHSLESGNEAPIAGGPLHLVLQFDSTIGKS